MQLIYALPSLVASTAPPVITLLLSGEIAGPPLGVQVRPFALLAFHPLIFSDFFIHTAPVPRFCIGQVCSVEPATQPVLELELLELLLLELLLLELLELLLLELLLELLLLELLELLLLELLLELLLLGLLELLGATLELLGATLLLLGGLLELLGATLELLGATLLLLGGGGGALELLGQPVLGHTVNVPSQSTSSPWHFVVLSSGLSTLALISEYVPADGLSHLGAFVHTISSCFTLEVAPLAFTSHVNLGLSSSTILVPATPDLTTILQVRLYRDSPEELLETALELEPLCKPELEEPEEPLVVVLLELPSTALEEEPSPTMLPEEFLDTDELEICMFATESTRSFIL